MTGRRGDQCSPNRAVRLGGERHRTLLACCVEQVPAGSGGRCDPAAVGFDNHLAGAKPLALGLRALFDFGDHRCGLLFAFDPDSIGEALPVTDLVLDGLTLQGEAMAAGDES